MQMIDTPVLGLADCHWREMRNQKLAQVRRLVSQSVSPDQMGAFVGSGPKWSAATPCEKYLEVLHLFRRFTHTHFWKHPEWRGWYELKSCYVVISGGMGGFGLSHLAMSDQVSLAKSCIRNGQNLKQIEAASLK